MKIPKGTIKRSKTAAVRSAAESRGRFERRSSTRCHGESSAARHSATRAGPSTGRVTRKSSAPKSANTARKACVE
ncbi:MAG: hypothetical protein R3A52_16490 [Polyangiales bacterium]